GYSDMALGLGKFFNINIPQNFNSPYKAVNISDFWRRWHMTLSRFLKDYLYIPLGGNRKGQNRTNVNLFITMLLGGLWHGANWTFLFWGGYHGLLLLMNKAWSKCGMNLSGWFSRCLTFFAVMVGWIFFRAACIQDAFDILRTMVSIETVSLASVMPGNDHFIHMLFLISVLFFVNLSPNSMQIIKRPLRRRYAMSFGLVFFLCLLSLHDAAVNHLPTKFLYYDF
ncbi:MAG: MBOAT family protein, partial [Deltaproteobacteria bacterium]|nr:MBOAT family protein [Deltaproteobacteria bacterium]